ncbi:MAG TPA: 4-(cytidine 5'-diphospho)-2-C-methyl-D-erythritol kinase [Devosia sp.]|nr:4-(cytidine 5'-diphospho)-2-C-methyl-D-erythritol kinase [Devosia sp.]
MTRAAQGEGVGFAPAKINLNLHVLGRRPDGFHRLQSLVVFARTGDRVVLRPGAGPDDRLLLAGPFASALAEQADGENNLVMSALSRFRERFPDALAHPLTVELEKNLPVAAGMGGGSSDAAATLRLLAELSRHPVHPDDLLALAASLGSDVPVCLNARAALMEGTGTRLTPAPPLPPFALVLANPGKGLSTARVFNGLARRDNPPFDLPEQGFARLEGLVDWLRCTRNDLEPSATSLLPETGEGLARLRRLPGSLFAAMSGSGATLFALFANLDAARMAAEQLRKELPGYWIAAADILP